MKKPELMMKRFMKKMIAGVLLVFSSAHSAHALEVSHIKERSSEREIIYSVNNDEMVFTLQQAGHEQIIKILKLRSDGRRVVLSSSTENYNFEIIKSMANASAKAYSWCWTTPSEARDPVFSSPPALIGAVVFIAPVVATVALCAVGPAVPILAGALILPIDALITLGDSILSPEAIATRKFRKLLNKKSSKASQRVFDELLQEISKL